ncbi:MAG: hypothetical protein HY321_16545 [Armatimonadetes bacterium]|nr:hypothetical protein [Armatimonadota bacterium]
MAIAARGARDIHTHSGQVTQTAQPYRAFMQISCLEMEKARRQQEMASAARRIEMLAARCREIEAEKDQLLRTLGERGGAALPSVPPRSSAARHIPERRGSMFRLRY